MKIMVFLVSFILIRTEAIAQQDPQFSQYMFLKQIITPGYVGTDQVFCATGAYRTQWLGFSGAPKTFLFCADAPIKALHGGGGIILMNNKLGNFDFTQAGIIYSYNKQVGKNGLLGIGWQAELVHTVVTNNWLTSSGTVIVGPNSENTNYNMGFGIYYRTERLYMGISLTNLLRQKYYSYQSTRHYYLIAGYNFLFSSRAKAVPSILIKSDDAVTTFDANLTFFWNDFLWVGASYRLQDAVVPMAGFAWKMRPKLALKIGYAYDIGISDLNMYHNNTHELLLKYCIKI